MCLVLVRQGSGDVPERRRLWPRCEAGPALLLGNAGLLKQGPACMVQNYVYITVYMYITVQMSTTVGVYIYIRMHMYIYI